jgi:hypothetical protein
VLEPLILLGFFDPRYIYVSEDTAGNVLDTDEKKGEKDYTFRPAFPFNRQISVVPPPVQDAQKPRGPVAVLFLLIIACTGVSAGMLRHIFRNSFDKSLRVAASGKYKNKRQRADNGKKRGCKKVFVSFFCR